MTEHQEPSEYHHRKLPELTKAEPWLRDKAERFARKWFHGDDEVVERATSEMLQELCAGYLEGYSDRMKSEVTEVKSETPKRTTRRKKR